MNGKNSARFLVIQSCWIGAVAREASTQCFYIEFPLIAHTDEQCPLDEYTALASVNANVSTFNATVPTETSNDSYAQSNQALLSSFRTHPTKSQTLILVPRYSTYVLHLEPDVAHRLRLRQQLIPKEDAMETAPYAQHKRKQPPLVLPELEAAAARLAHNQSDAGAIGTVRPFSWDTDATVPLLLQSHPGRAITSFSTVPQPAGFMLLGQENYVDMSVGNATEALRIRLRAVEPIPTARSTFSNHDKRYELETDTGLVWIVSADVTAGASVTLTNLHVDVTSSSTAALFTDCHVKCQFIINPDGSISPVSARHLAVGVAPYPAVTLVPRDSPHRVLVAHADTFWSAPAPPNGTVLHLASHPGLAIVPQTRQARFGAFGLLEMQPLGIGPAYEAICFEPLDYGKHHQFLLYQVVEQRPGLKLSTLNLQIERGMPLRLFRYNRTNVNWWITFWLQLNTHSGGNMSFIVNEEGTISPLNAPHLALGCEDVPAGRVNELVTDEQRQLAHLLAQSHLFPKENNPNATTTDTLEMIRFNHLVCFLLFAEGLAPYTSFVIVVCLLLLIKVVPRQIWFTLVIWAWFDMAAVMTYFAFWLGFATIKALRRWIKTKRQRPPVALPPANEINRRPV